MRFYSKRWELNIEISDINPTTLVIEKPEVLADICNDIWMQSNGICGDIIFSIDGVEQKISKVASVIFNPFAISCNDKKIISKLYKEMYETAQESFYEETSGLLCEIVSYLDALCMEMPYPIKYSSEFNSEGLYKLFDISIDDDATNLLEKLINYIKMIHRIAGIDKIIILGLKRYLSTEEINSLYKEIQYENVTLLNIENSYDCKLQDEHVIILDKELCQINLD